jgi:hypothetical protein
MHFLPVEFLEQSSYSFLEPRIDEASRTETTVIVHPRKESR